MKRQPVSVHLPDFLRSLWAPVTYWLVSGATLSILTAEHILEPLGQSPTALNIARISAYGSIGMILVSVVALALIWALAIRLSMQWFKLVSSYRDVVTAAFGALWVLGSYAAAGVILFLILKPPPLSLKGVPTWNKYMGIATSQQPFHLLAHGQVTLTIVSLMVVFWILRQKIRCAWTDCALTIGAGTMGLMLCIYVVEFAGKLVNRL